MDLRPDESRRKQLASASDRSPNAPPRNTRNKFGRVIRTYYYSILNTCWREHTPQRMNIHICIAIISHHRRSLTTTCKVRSHMHACSHATTLRRGTRAHVRETGRPCCAPRRGGGRAIRWSPRAASRHAWATFSAWASPSASSASPCAAIEDRRADQRRIRPFWCFSSCYFSSR